MRSLFLRGYPILIMTILFVLLRVAFPDLLHTSGYIVSYILFLVFARPLLLDRSILETFERYLPQRLREWAAGRRQKRLVQGPFVPYRILIVYLILALLLCVLYDPIAADLTEAVSLQEQDLSDDSSVETLLNRVGVLLSIVVFSLLLIGNLMKRGYIDWYTNTGKILLQDYRWLWHTINILFLVVLSPVLVVSSYLSNFISENIGDRIMLAIQLVIVMILWPGERLLRKRQR